MKVCCTLRWLGGIACWDAASNQFKSTKSKKTTPSDCSRPLGPLTIWVGYEEFFLNHFYFFSLCPSSPVELDGVAMVRRCRACFQAFADTAYPLYVYLLKQDTCCEGQHICPLPSPLEGFAKESKRFIVMSLQKSIHCQCYPCKKTTLSYRKS